MTSRYLQTIVHVDMCVQRLSTIMFQDTQTRGTHWDFLTLEYRIPKLSLLRTTDPQTKGKRIIRIIRIGRKRAGLCPDFRLRLPTAAGPLDSLGELKFISAGVSRYPNGSIEKQVDRRARELPGCYRRLLERLDRLHHGTQDGEDQSTGQKTSIFWRVTDLCGRQLGRRLRRSPCTSSKLVQRKSFSHLPIFWETRG